MSTANASISVRNLTKYYGELLALDHLTFSVEPGEVVGFLGPNGAGKTTAMKILTCFMSANAGEARVAGYDVYREAHRVRERVGYLPENNPLYADMVVYDYLRHIGQVRRVRGRRLASRIDAMAELCGLRAVMHRDIRHLSKGYRQRVGLAQAMIHEPEVLILDEPTSGLDPNQILEIRDLIKAIGKEKTVILSTHILQEVTAVCDRILIIDKGRLVLGGQTQALAQEVECGVRWVLRLAHGAELQRVADACAALPGVVEAEVDGEAVTVLCHDQALGQRLVALAKAHDWPLQEVWKQALGLEEIFRRVTGRSAALMPDAPCRCGGAEVDRAPAGADETPVGQAAATVEAPAETMATASAPEVAEAMPEGRPHEEGATGDLAGAEVAAVVPEGTEEAAAETAPSASAPVGEEAAEAAAPPEAKGGAAKGGATKGGATKEGAAKRASVKGAKGKTTRRAKS